MNRFETNAVLISVPVVQKEGDVSTVMVRTTYSNGMLDAGLVPVPIYPGLSINQIKELYSHCPAIVFTGGVDWNPKTYDQKPHPKTQQPDDERDRLELMLLEMAINDEKPMVAICRGAQGLAIVHYRLASVKPKEPVLIQHLPDVTQVQHSVANYEALFFNNHEVSIADGTLAKGIFVDDHVHIASGHHQGINSDALIKLPVVVSGLSSDDKVVEMIEAQANEGHFCIGIQGHPEVNPNLRGKLFGQLRQAASEYSERSRF